MAKAAVNDIWGILFRLINMVGMAKPLTAKVRIRFRVMAQLEGGQRGARGACDGPTLGLGGMYFPNCPT